MSARAYRKKEDSRRRLLRMPPTLAECSVCLGRMSRSVFRDLEGVLVCRLCELDRRLDQVLVTFQGLRRRDDGGEDGIFEGKVFVLEQQLRIVAGEYEEMREEISRTCESVAEVRNEVRKVQEDLVSKRDLETFAADLSRSLRSDMEKASKSLADQTRKLVTVNELVVHALQLDGEASRGRIDRRDPVRSRGSVGGLALTSYRDVLGKSLQRQQTSTPKPMSGLPVMDVSSQISSTPKPKPGVPTSRQAKRSSAARKLKTGTKPLPRAKTSTGRNRTQPRRGGVDSGGFQQVQNRFTFVNRPAFVMPTRNTFERFTDLDGEIETLVLGDSIVRHQAVEFVHRCKAKRRVICKPGATIEKIRGALAEVDVSSRETLIICHVGTNDLRRTRSEDLLAKYRQLISNLKAKTDRVAITSILPRMYDDDELYSKLTYTNRALETICKSNGVSFINLFDDFRERPDLFLRDGLHLNDVGNARLGRLLHLSTKKYYAHKLGVQRALNGPVLAAGNPT